MNKELNFYKEMVNRYGWGKAFYAFFLEVMNKFFYVNVVTCLVVEEVNPASLHNEQKYDHGFIENEELKLYLKEMNNQKFLKFVNEASMKDDKCYVVKDQKEIIAYSWYSNQGTLTDIKNLTFSFDNSYVYMYKGFTKSDFRGQRLYPMGMSCALQKYLDLGFKGFINYVEATNYDSLKSCYRMGYKKVGTIIVINIFGINYLHHSKSLNKYNIRLKSIIDKATNYLQVTWG